MMLSYLSTNQFLRGFRSNLNPLKVVQSGRRSLHVLKGSMKSENEISAPKKPSLFKSIRLRKQIVNVNKDIVSKVSEIGGDAFKKLKKEELLTQEPAKTKMTKTKALKSTVEELFTQEPANTKATKTKAPKKIVEELLMQEPANTKVTEAKASKKIVVQEDNRLESIKFYADDDELENIFNEGSDYVDRNSITLSSDEQANRAEKLERSNRKPNNLKPSIDDAKIKEIQELIEKRFDHKYHREFDEADSIRERLLEEYDVEIFDKKGIWQTKDRSVMMPLKGFSKSYADKVQPAKPVKCSLPWDDVQRLIEERTRYRRARNFDMADQIRNQLADAGIEVMDKSNEWRSFDGTLSGMQSKDFGNPRSF